MKDVLICKIKLVETETNSQKGNFKISLKADLNCKRDIWIDAGRESMRGSLFLKKEHSRSNNLL